ncbi:hypothetical protein HYU92_00510 [Candidatus Curtissbacteria bacterium]|nr:hypothetical protein [Candidatus Curtissbacteria bacterium]
MRLVFLILFSATPAYAGGLNVPTNIKLDQIECGVAGKNNAYAYFSWDSAQGATSYRFYSKIADGTDKYRAYDEVTAPNYELSFNPQFDFYVAVSSVNTFTGNPPSAAESNKSADFYLSAKKLLTLCYGGQNKLTQSVPNTPWATVSAQQSKDLEQAQTKIAQLEKKLANVESNLKETQQKQSALEKIVNNLLNFLGRLFKFQL